MPLATILVTRSYGTTDRYANFLLRIINYIIAYNSKMF